MMQLLPRFSENEISHMGLIELHEFFKKTFRWLVAEKKVRESEHEKDLMGPYWPEDGGEHVVRSVGSLCDNQLGNKNLSPTAAKN